MKDRFQETRAIVELVIHNSQTGDAYTPAVVLPLQDLLLQRNFSCHQVDILFRRDGGQFEYGHWLVMAYATRDLNFCLSLI
jgi:hypothetical protein